MSVEFSEVQQYLKDNAHTQEVKDLLKPTAEAVNEFLDSQEGAKLIQPRLDVNFTKGLQTWKDNHLQGLIDEAVVKANPQETPEQKRIRELEQKVQEAERARAREQLTNVATKHATEKGLPVELVDFFLGEDEQSTLTNLNVLDKHYQSVIQKQVDDRFKGNGRTVKQNQGDKNMTKEQFDALSYAEKAALYNDNPELFNQLAE